VRALRIAACIALATASVATGAAEAPIRIVDHHIHVLGPDLLRDWKSLGVPFSKPDEAYLSAGRYFQPSEASEGRPAAVVTRAVLVPMAHLYGNEEFRTALGLSVEEERERVARENDHVAAEARRLGESAAAFCSLPLGRPYTFDELARCRSELASPGLKLHLAASGIDLRSDSDLEEIGRVMDAAVRDGLTVLLHLDPQRRGLEVEDVRRFVDRVLAPRPGLEIVIAHLGGSGGYGAWTRDVFATISGWLAERAQAGDPRPGVRFDLSAVILAEPSEGVPATTPEEVSRLAGDLRRAGLERLVFGSDAPVFDPREAVFLWAERTDLTAAELEAIRTRALPILEPAPAQ